MARRATVRRATVRRATEHDVPALFLMLRRYFVEGEVEHTDDESAVLAQVLEASPGFFIAELAGELAGCVLCRVIEGMPGSAECKRMYVSPEFRGHGIARLLMDTIEAEARKAGLEWMYLDSKDGFATAIAMYRRRGYVECPRFNNNREATVFLRKPLT